MTSYSSGLPAWVKKLGRPTGHGVRVGIISTGYDNTQPDPRVLPGVGFEDSSDGREQLQTADDHDRTGHGTVCAHLVLRVAPDAQVVPIRIFDEVLETSPPTMLSALQWAVDERLDVLCIAASCVIEAYRDLLYYGCEMGRRSGMILVCSGNPENAIDYPAVFEPVIGVLRGRFATPFDFRYHPDFAYEVDAWAEVERPGRVPPGYGVSYHAYAVAVVAGIVAMLRERHPGAPVERIRELLQRFSV